MEVLKKIEVSIESKRVYRKHKTFAGGFTTLF